MKRKLWIVMAAIVLLTLLWCGAATASALHFLNQPTSTFQGSNRTFAISWETNFIPVRVEIHKYNIHQNNSDETVASVTESELMGRAMTWPIPAHKDVQGDFYHVLAFYGTHNADRIQSLPFLTVVSSLGKQMRPEPFHTTVP